MAFRPMLPGILSGVPSDAVTFEMTAGDGFGYDGYVSAQADSDFFSSALGSVTGDVSADGGTVEILIDNNGSLYILNGNQSATNVNIDGTDYALTYDSTNSDGYDFYNFTGPDFVPGTTYQITVT